VDALEQELGGGVLYFNGIIGDCSPDGGGSEYEGAETFGQMVADAALSAMQDFSLTVSVGMHVEHRTWNQDVTNEGFIGLHQAGILDYAIDEVPTDAGPELGIRTQGGYVRFGNELQLVTFPGEALTRTGLAIKAVMKTDYRLFLGLTTDTLGYFVLPDEWMATQCGTGDCNGNYEETVSTGETAGQNAVDNLTALIAADSF
jgi:hypothetical protein